MKDLFPKLKAFLSTHKSFIKRLIIFAVCYTILTIFSNENISYMFSKIFGEWVITAFHALIPTYLLTCEV